MLLILLIWLFYFFFFSGIGLLFSSNSSKSLVLSNQTIIGFAIVVAVAFFYHFFGSSGWWLGVFFCTLSCVGYYVKGKYFLKTVWYSFLEAPKIQKLVAFGNVFMLAAYSALPSNVIDDGIYYSQSIRWYEEIGIVKGLANFDYNLIQVSSLHALESIVNFNSLGYRFNDLAGFLVALVVLDIFIWAKKFRVILVAVVSVSILLLFTLISAPNTDVVIASLTINLFFNWQIEDENRLRISGYIIPAMVLIKLSALPFLLILLFQKQKWSKLLALASCLAVMFRAWIVSGHPLAPFISWNPFNSAWVIPEAAFTSWKKVNELLVYRWPLTETVYRDHTLIEKGKALFLSNGISSILNLLLLCFVLLYILKVKKKIVKSLLGIVLVSFIPVYFATTAQSRIALPYIILAALLLFETFKITNTKSVYGFNFLWLLPVLLLFIPWTFISKFSPNNSWQMYRNMSIRQFFIPAPTWNAIAVEKHVVNGIAFYSPTSRDMFCFDSEFPCSYAIARDYLNEQYVYIPIMLGDKIHDGFGFESIPKDSLLNSSFKNPSMLNLRDYFEVK